MRHASGTFEIKMTPQDDKSGDTYVGRMIGDKQLHGDLEGTGRGQMLYAKSENNESGAYVAIEKISGTLHGRKGTFVFYHTGVIARGEQQLNVNVVPDSGTGELTGITGKFMIKIDDKGNHSYEFDYTLPKAP